MGAAAGAGPFQRSHISHRAPSIDIPSHSAFLPPWGHLPPVCMLYGSAWALCYPPRYLNLKNLALDSCFHAACCSAICPDRFSPWTPHSHPPPFLELGEITESVPTPAFLRIPDMKAVVKHAESSPIYFFLPYIPSTLMSGEYLREKNLTWPTTPECQDKQLPGRRCSAVSRWGARMHWTRMGLFSELPSHLRADQQDLWLEARRAPHLLWSRVLQSIQRGRGSCLSLRSSSS